jgi:hypothetical protein
MSCGTACSTGSTRGSFRLVWQEHLIRGRRTFAGCTQVATRALWSSEEDLHDTVSTTGASTQLHSLNSLQCTSFGQAKGGGSRSRTPAGRASWQASSVMLWAGSWPSGG